MSTDDNQDADRRRIACDNKREAAKQTKITNRAERTEEEQTEVSVEDRRLKTAIRAERTEEEHTEVGVEDRRRESTKKADINADPMDGLRNREILEGSF